MVTLCLQDTMPSTSLMSSRSEVRQTVSINFLPRSSMLKQISIRIRQKRLFLHFNLHYLSEQYLLMKYDSERLLKHEFSSLKSGLNEKERSSSLRQQISENNGVKNSKINFSSHLPYWNQNHSMSILKKEILILLFKEICSQHHTSLSLKRGVY